MVLSAPALGGVSPAVASCRLCASMAGKEDLCLVVLLKVRIFVVLFPPEAVGYLVAGRLYCFTCSPLFALNLPICPQVVLKLSLTNVSPNY